MGRQEQGVTLLIVVSELSAKSYRNKVGSKFSPFQTLRVLSRKAFCRGQGVITRRTDWGVLWAKLTPIRPRFLKLSSFVLYMLALF